jgi:CBS domain-containing protein
MAYLTVQDVLKNRPKPVSVLMSLSLGDALTIMRDNDFGQLPVVDADERPIGLLHQSQVLRVLLQLGCPINGLLVKAVMSDQFEKVEFDEGIIEAANRMANANVVFVVRSEKLVDVLTVHDVARFFRQRASELMRIEEIETSIREHLRQAYKDDAESLSAGAAKAKNSATKVTVEKLYGAIRRYHEAPGLEPPMRDDTKLEIALKVLGVDTAARVSFEDLTLQEYITMLFDRNIWSDRANILNSMPRDTLNSLLARVRDIRNVLFHFKRDLTADERESLEICADFFGRHSIDGEEEAPSPFLIVRGIAVSQDSDSAVASATVEYPEVQDDQPAGEEPTNEDGKYTPLTEFLRNQKLDQDKVTLTLEQIEGIIRAPLPDAANNLRSWWSNDSERSAHAIEWLEAGWRVGGVNLTLGHVTFYRLEAKAASYIDFFSLVRSKGVDRGVKFDHAQNTGVWWHILFRQGSHPKYKRSIAQYNASFSTHGRCRIEVYLDTGDKDTNKTIFGKLESRRAEIEAVFGDKLVWERLENRRGCRIAAYTKGSVDNEPEQLERLAEWTVENIDRLYKAFHTPLDECSERTPEP